MIWCIIFLWLVIHDTLIIPQKKTAVLLFGKIAAFFLGNFFLQPLKRLFRRLEAKIPKIPVTYVRTQQTNCDISYPSTAILYHITAYLSTLYHLEKIKFQIIRFRHIEKYRVVRGLLSCFNKLELNACVLCSTHYHFHKQPVLHKMRT